MRRYIDVGYDSSREWKDTAITLLIVVVVAVGGTLAAAFLFGGLLSH